MIGDSQYVLKGMTEWLRNWKARGWRTAQRKPVLNAELWQALEAAVAQHADVRWTWVRGHNGHALNERADQIASEEASRARR
jgi:ribonuclease HI